MLLISPMRYEIYAVSEPWCPELTPSRGWQDVGFWFWFLSVFLFFFNYIYLNHVLVSLKDGVLVYMLFLGGGEYANISMVYFWGNIFFAIECDVSYMCR